MLYYFTRLQRHPSVINPLIALPNVVSEPAPVMVNGIVQLVFEDLAADEDIPARLAKLEKLANVKPGTYALHNEDFWEELRTKISGDEMTILDDTKPIDQLRIAYLKAKDSVAQADKDKGGTGFDYLLINTGNRVKVKAAAIKVSARANKIFYELDDKKAFLSLLGSNRVKDVFKLSDDEVDVRLSEYITAAPDDFCATFDDPLRTTRFSLRKAIAYGVMTTVGSTYYFTDDIKRPLGNGSEQEMLEWLRDPENSEDRRTLEAALQKI
jgi:hypothetical protein